MIESSSQSFIFYNFILYEICYITIKKKKKKKKKEKKKERKKERKKEKLPCIYFVSIIIYWPNLHFY